MSKYLGNKRKQFEYNDEYDIAGNFLNGKRKRDKQHGKKQNKNRQYDDIIRQMKREDRDWN